MAELQIVCLGEFQVTLAGTALTGFQTDKTRALLAYLAIEGRAHQRSELAQLLWPGYSAESARHSLRQSLFQLRNLLGDADADPPWLLLERQAVQLNPAAPVRVDARTFTQLLAACKTHAHADLATCAACLDRLRAAVDPIGVTFWQVSRWPTAIPLRSGGGFSRSSCTSRCSTPWPNSAPPPNAQGTTTAHWGPHSASWRWSPGPKPPTGR